MNLDHYKMQNHKLEVTVSRIFFVKVKVRGEKKKKKESKFTL